MQESPKYSVHIHVGASSLSLLLSEFVGAREQHIEYLEQPIPIARDIFRGGKVKKETIERCAEILLNYLTLLQEYGLSAQHVTVAAVTNIIREAKNHHDILNRLQIASNIEFFALDNGSMTRLIFKKIQRRQEEATIANQGITLALHVGPGNTRALLLKEGKVERFSTYRLGTHRTAESLRTSNIDGAQYLKVIQDHCDAQISTIIDDYKKEHINHIILIGYEIQLIAHQLNDGPRFKNSTKRYEQFLKYSSSLTEGERVKQFHLDYHAEDAFLPALQINLSILKAFGAKKFWIPNTEYEKGLLSDLSSTQVRGRKLETETLHAARLLAAKYNADVDHYEHVLELVISLFEQTKDVHQLEEWELLLLKVATIVHEVGGYISPRMHHKHSLYLIKHSEIFGLDERSLMIIALVARYHRQSTPKTSHREYTNLHRADQILVSKLSALLRVADALDVSEKKHVEALQIKKIQNNLMLYVVGEPDLNLIHISLQNKGDLFESLFGLNLVVEHITKADL